MESTVERIIEAAKEATRKRIEVDAKRVSEPLRPLLVHVAKRVFDASFNVDALKREIYFNTNTYASFGNELGATPWDYISRRRMETARQLLCETSQKELSVWRISKHVGYDDCQNFSGRYKRVMGEMPSAVRKSSGDPRKRRRRTMARAAAGGETAPGPSVFLELLGEGLDGLDQALGHEKTVKLFRERVELGSAEMMERMGEQSLKAGRRQRKRGVELAEVALAAVEGTTRMAEEEGMLWRALGWARLGNARRLAADYEGAEGMIRRGVEMLEGVPWEARARGLAEALGYRGVLRADQRRFEEAGEALSEAIAQARTAKGKSLEAQAWTQLATVFLYQGKAAEAGPPLKKAHEIVEADLREDPIFRMAINLQLALAYALSGNVSEAKCFLPIAWNLATELGHHPACHQAQWIEAMIYEQEGNEEDAEKRLREARQGFLDISDADHAAIASLDLALLCRRQGRLGEVAILASDALQVLEALQLPEALATFKLLRKAIAENNVTRSLLETARDFLVRRV